MKRKKEKKSVWGLKFTPKFTTNKLSRERHANINHFTSDSIITKINFIKSVFYLKLSLPKYMH